MIKIERFGPKDSDGPWRCDWCDSYHKTAYVLSSTSNPDFNLLFGRLCIWKFLKHVYTHLGKKLQLDEK